MFAEKSSILCQLIGTYQSVENTIQQGRYIVNQLTNKLPYYFIEK